MNDRRKIRNYEDSLPIALLRAREAVMARFRPHLADNNITEQQWRVIRALADEGPADATRLAQRCCILTPSVSRIVKSLEKDGYISREKADGDGRRNMICLTGHGQALFRRMAPRSAEIHEEIERELGAEITEGLIRDLQGLRRKLG